MFLSFVTNPVVVVLYAPVFIIVGDHDGKPVGAALSLYVAGTIYCERVLPAPVSLSLTDPYNIVWSSWERSDDEITVEAPHYPSAVPVPMYGFVNEKMGNAIGLPLVIPVAGSK